MSGCVRAVYIHPLAGHVAEWCRTRAETPLNSTNILKHSLNRNNRIDRERDRVVLGNISLVMAAWCRLHDTEIRILINEYTALV